jgi:hypothetical protein
MQEDKSIEVAGFDAQNEILNERNQIDSNQME